MAKLVLNDLVNLQNETTAVASINANNESIENALENTLSRDGTSPNSMEANLDMNSFRILNLPIPETNNEPVRLVDLINLAESTGTTLASDIANDSATVGGATVADALDLIEAEIANITVDINASDVIGLTEAVQDDIGTILVDSSRIDFTYNDSTPSITADIIANSIGTSQLATTAVTPGSYTNSSITVGADGRLTAASTGTPPATNRTILTGNLSLYVGTAPVTATITIASPGVVTITSHGLIANDPVRFTTTGALPTSVSEGVIYYVKTVNDANTFTLSNTPGGSVINTTGSQSGVHNLTTGSDSNDGTTNAKAHAWLTVGKAWQYIQRTLDLAGQWTVTVNISGAYNEANTFSGPIVGATGPNSVIFQGANNAGNSSNTIDKVFTTAGGALTFYLLMGAQAHFKKLTLGSTGASGFTLTADGGGSAIFHGDNWFMPGGGGHLFSAGGYIIAQAAYTILQGTVNIHAVSENNGVISCANTAVTLSGTPAFTVAFVQADLGGMQEWFGATFTGAGTGSRYNAILGGILHTTNGSSTFFPGNSAGSSSGGVYA